jgi:hypothetical protein
LLTGFLQLLGRGDGLVEHVEVFARFTSTEIEIERVFAYGKEDFHFRSGFRHLPSTASSQGARVDDR